MGTTSTNITTATANSLRISDKFVCSRIVLSFLGLFRIEINFAPKDRSVERYQERIQKIKR
ncbi:MAG: hypothetical protein AMJ42_00610 [Deltaproteobacteria bacterium DG_8]|nr:MAG: hypothetical protein AMJ42_00610 [Deltaproteobacteria bacterium DG_8]